MQNPSWEVLNNSLLWSFCKDFVDISYENASFLILEDSIWLQLIYCLTTIALWFVKYLFTIVRNTLN